MAATVVLAMEEETRTVVWNLVYYLITRFQIAEDSAARPLLVFAGALLCIAVPYLLGSINPAILISRIKYKRDIRTCGSGNPGATNMLRTFGKGAAAATLILDLLKAALSFYFGLYLLGINGSAIAGFFVVFGHMFPIFNKFQGGKGVACLAAIALCTSPLTFAIVLLIWLIIVIGTRYVSLASVMSALLYPLILRAFTGSSAGLTVAMAILSAIFVVFRHKENLKRLYHGQESKIQLRKKRADSDGKGETPSNEGKGK